MNENVLTQMVISEFKRRVFDESYERIYKCLNELSEEEIGQRPNEQLSSIGNLIVHLCGNARQWIISGLGEENDIRQRKKEFLSTTKYSKWKLKRMMEELKRDIENVLDNLNVDALMKKRQVQVFEENGLSIMIHVIEHFSYHTGQITWYTKYLKNKDMKYYGNLKL